MATPNSALVPRLALIVDFGARRSLSRCIALRSGQHRLIILARVKRLRMSNGRVTLMLVIAIATSACGFLQSRARVSAEAQCQQSCANVPANTQGQCIARCQ
jgi:hypothetical protein